MASHSAPHPDLASAAAERTQAARQAITPAMHRWIIEQAQAGHTVPVMLQSMRASGWGAHLAADVLTLTLQEQRNEKASKKKLPNASSTPGPRLQDSPARSIAATAR